MVRWCPRCWRENPYSAAECAGCGAELQAPEAGDRVERLIVALGHPLGSTRRLVATLLGATRDPRALSALAEAARRAIRQRDWELLDGVVEGLENYGSRAALPTLCVIAEAGYLGARRAAAEAIERLRQPA